jgi:ADP-heptose:LPS heptosyltransferase
MRLLVIRTSAMGDVALLTPILKSMREQHPEVELILLTRPAFKAFFTSIDGLKLFCPDFKRRHKGIVGLFTLFRDIRKQGRIDYVIDLHNVIRSKILRFFFWISGNPAKKIDKGRNEKRLVIKGKKKENLSHSVERYRDVFEKADYKITLSERPWIIPSHYALSNALKIAGIEDDINIGVAPYAKHLLKMWPEENMIILLKLISEKFNAKYWLFGGNEESERLVSFQIRVPGSIVLSGKLQLEEELAIMTRLSFMISMDSSNMHMAALTGTKVISIWGATDPVTGFGAWGQPDEHSVRIPFDQLTCRPCTVYGKGKCRRKDHACMKWLTPEMVFQRIINLNILK